MGLACCLDQTTLSKVNKYVDKITYNLNEHKREVYSFKNDIKISIIVVMEELVAIGYTAEAAFQYAAQKCEEDSFIKRELENLKGNNKVQKVYKRTAAAALIIALLMLIIAYIHNVIILTSLPNIDFSSYSDVESVKVNSENSLRNLVNNNWYIKAGALNISDTPNSKKILEKLDFTYSSDGNNIRSDYFQGNERGLIFTYHNYQSSTSILGTDKIANIIYRYVSFGPGYFILTLLVFLLYWITFALWGGINVQYAGCDKHWKTLILLTNIVGYIAFKYHLDKEREQLSLVQL